MNRAERRRTARTTTTNKPVRNDSPDLSGINLSSLAERFILVTVTVPDALKPDEVVEGIVDSYNKEARKSPPWLSMEAEQAYPGDIVGDGTGILLGDVSDDFLGMLLEALDDTQVRRVASITLQRCERLDELADIESKMDAIEATLDAVEAVQATVIERDGVRYTSVPLDEV